MYLPRLGRRADQLNTAGSDGFMVPKDRYRQCRRCRLREWPATSRPLGRGCAEFCLDGKFTAGEGLLVRKHNDNQEARSPQGHRRQNHLAVRPWHNCARVQSHLEEMYGTAVSPSLISSVTDPVSEEVKAWQARPLDATYPIVYLDCIHVKVREGAVRVKAVYLAIGINNEWREGGPGPVGGTDVGHRAAQPGRTGHLHRLR